MKEHIKKFQIKMEIKKKLVCTLLPFYMTKDNLTPRKPEFFLPLRKSLKDMNSEKTQ